MLYPRIYNIKISALFWEEMRDVEEGILILDLAILLLDLLGQKYKCWRYEMLRTDADLTCDECAGGQCDTVSGCRGCSTGG